MKLSKNHKNKIKKALIGIPRPENVREKISKANTGRRLPLEMRKRISNSLRELWKNNEYVKMMEKARHIFPNKPETILLNLLNELYPNEWKYTGDFSFMINGKNPDFANCNGQKKCIELFGDYWHREQNPKDRKDIFKEFGYDTLVIWERELKNIPRLKRKISKFNGKGGSMV